MPMKIEPQTVTIRELVADYSDRAEAGVSGYGGKLDIRPPYQREFVYKPAQQIAVIDTVLNGLPLNTMYWAKTVDEEGEASYEVLDGQQRTISICRYYSGNFSVDRRYFHSLTTDEQEQFLNYELQVYVCEGTDSEKLAWFQRINLAGVQLSDQELRNAVYVGRWLADAKRYFSRPGAAAEELSNGLVKGSPLRQDLLEKALEWIIDYQREDDGRKKYPEIEDYMSAHQHDPNAGELWRHFSTVIEWVKATFPVDRSEREGRDWGRLFREHGDRMLDADALEARIVDLISDDEVTRKAGVYDYVLSGDTKHLSLRTFTKTQKATMFSRQGGKCANPSITGHDPDKTFTIAQMEADHITPWSQQGKTELANGQMLCKDCNRRKSNS